MSVFFPIPTKKGSEQLIHSEQTTYTFTVLPQGYFNAPALGITQSRETWTGWVLMRSCIIRPAEQAVTSALETSVARDSKEREENTEDSEVCRVSNICRGLVVWGMLRHPPKVKDMLLALRLPTSRKEAPHLASEIYRSRLPTHMPGDMETCPL